MAFIQKTWIATEEALRELSAINNALGEPGMSSAIRYCIKQVFANGAEVSPKEARANG